MKDELNNSLDGLLEALKKKMVVRDGKRVEKWTTTNKEDFRVEYDANGKPKEVRITAEERRNREKGQKSGKLKRKAQQGNIQAKRKRSFRVRKNSKLGYNKDNPEIIRSRGKDGKIEESLKLILESPHSYLFGDYVWDFYAEVNDDSSWLQQIVDIYKDRKLVSVVDGDKSNNRESGNIIRIGDSDIEEITNNLMFNLSFIATAGKDYLSASEELKKEMDKYIPREFLLQIKHMANKIAEKENRGN